MPNNISAFYVVYIPIIPYGVGTHTQSLTGYYYANTDTLNDYGKIEISFDFGSTWIDLINDTSGDYRIYWNPKPVLTGNSNGWVPFDISIQDGQDTVIYRFTFHSDSIPEALDGLMFDNLSFGDFVSGIQNYLLLTISSSVFPNPSSGNFFIQFDNPEHSLFELKIYNDTGKRVFTNDNVLSSTIMIEKQELQPGLYCYQLTNWKSKQIATGKFIIQK